MKKFISLFISLTMLVSAFTAMPVFAENEEAETEKTYEEQHTIFDIDFSDGQITDKTETVESFWTNGTQFASFSAKDGSGEIPYAKFVKYDAETAPAKNNAHHIIAEKDYRAALKNKDKTSVEMWFKASLDSNTHAMPFAITGANGGNNSWGLRLSGAWNEMQVIGNGAQVITIKSVDGRFKTGSWAHVVLTREQIAATEGEEAKIKYQFYIDGELAGEATVAGTINDGDDDIYPSFGQIYVTDVTNESLKRYMYDGGLATATMYDDVLTEEKIKEHYNAQKSKFIGFEDEHTIFDISFNGGTISDTTGNVGSFWKNAPEIASFSAEDGSGSILYAKFVKVDSSAQKNDNGHHIIANDREKIMGKQKTSVELWFKASLDKSTRAMPFAFTGANGGNNKWGVNMSAEYNEIKVVGNGTDQLKITPLDTKFKMGAWTHIVLTREQIAATEDTAAQIKYQIYIDGELAGETTAAGTIDDGDYNSIYPCFGQIYLTDVTNADVGKYMYDGGLAEATMYDDIMTADLVKSHYNEDKAKYQTFGDNVILDIDFADNAMSDKYGVNSSYSWNNFATATEAAKNGDGNLVYADFSKNAPKNEPKYVTINNGNSQCFIGENQLTVEAWMKAEFKNGVRRYMYDGEQWWAGSYNSGNKSYFEVKAQGGQVILSSDNMNYKDGDWMHLILTRDFDGTSTGTYKAYIDGKLIGTGTCSKDKALTGADIFFGGINSTSATAYTGGIGDIKVYKGIMTDDEARAAYNAEKDRYMTFDEQHLVFDASFENNTITDKNEVAEGYWKSNTLSFGEEANGTPYLHFDGKEENFFGFGGTDAQQAVVKKIAGNDEASVEFWLRTGDASDKEQHIFALHRYGAVGGMWKAYVKGGKLVHMSKDSNSVSGEISLGGENKWAHIVLTRKYDEATGMTYQTYVNGVLADTQTKTDITPADDLNGGKADHLMFGSWYYTDEEANAFNGDFGAIRVYDGIVSAEKVAATYAAEKEKFVNIESKLEIGSVTFYDDDEEELKELGSNKTVAVQASLTNTFAEAKDVIMYVGLYAENGKLLAITQSEKTSIKADNDVHSVDATLKIPDSVTVDPYGKIKVFVWTGDGFMTPVSSEVYSLNCL